MNFIKVKTYCFIQEKIDKSRIYANFTCAIHLSSGSSISREFAGESDLILPGDNGASNGEVRSRGGFISLLVLSLTKGHWAVA